MHFAFVSFSSGYQLIDSEFEANLTSSCNMYCDCSNNDLEPICGINGLTYFSPCHAGCTQFNAHEVAPNEKSMVSWFILSQEDCLSTRISVCPAVSSFLGHSYCFFMPHFKVGEGGCVGGI